MAQADAEISHGISEAQRRLIEQCEFFTHAGAVGVTIEQLFAALAHISPPSTCF